MASSDTAEMAVTAVNKAMQVGEATEAAHHHQHQLINLSTDCAALLSSLFRWHLVNRPFDDKSTAWPALSAPKQSTHSYSLTH